MNGSGAPEPTGGGLRPGPLDGLVVLDLSRMLAGPFTTMVLADLGATVIKVEPPFGDMTRAQGPFTEDDELKAYGGYFQSVNRNKRGIVVDLTSPGGPEVVRRLARGADVLVENFRPGVMEKYGLGYEDLARENPALVYTAVRGFGDPRTGATALQGWPSYDIVAQAMGGLLGVTGPVGQPTKTGPGLGDIIPALFAATGAMAALAERRVTGRGRFVDVGMFDAVLAACERIVYQYSYTGQVPGPEGNAHPLLAPFSIFPASDGWVSLAAAPADHHWVLLCELMGQPELAHDPRFATNVDRVAHQEEVLALVGAWTAGLSRAELTTLLGGRVPVGPVNTADMLVEDPHLLARGMIQEVEHPGAGRPVVIAGSPIKFAGTPDRAPRRAPLLGEHTRDVLAQAGLDAAAVDRLFACGAVR